MDAVHDVYFTIRPYPLFRPSFPAKPGERAANGGAGWMRCFQDNSDAAVIVLALLAARAAAAGNLQDDLRARRGRAMERLGAGTVAIFRSAPESVYSQDSTASIGVRIEDSFLLTEKGLERMSAAAPRTVEEIERVMRR
jgi:hypothetical protein